MFGKFSKREREVRLMMFLQAVDAFGVERAGW